jgi:hypothetical protein
MTSSIKRSCPFFFQFLSHSVRRFLVQSLKVAPLALVALTGSGCGTTTINVDVDASRPVVQQMPVSVGVYYPPATQNYRYRFFHIHDWDIHLGDMSVRFWNKVFSRTFDKIVLLEQHPLDSPPGDSRLDAIIEVRIKDSWWREFYHTGGSWSGNVKTYPASAGIYLTFALRCPNGAPVAEWYVRATGTMRGRAPTWPSTRVREPMEDAFLDAARKFSELSLLAQLGTLECPD